MTDPEKIQRALAHRFDSDVGPNLTVREYLKALLAKLWRQGESFSAEYPFGCSIWRLKVLMALAAGGFIDYTIGKPSNGEIVNGMSFVAECIEAL
jgi:hypothetical protein